MDATKVTGEQWNTQKVSSSGLISFTMAQAFCKNVTLYGFYPYQRDEFGVPVLYHYYEPKLLNFHTGTHNFDAEHRLLRSLHDQHVLKLVIGSCRNRNKSVSLRPIPDQPMVQPKVQSSKFQRVIHPKVQLKSQRKIQPKFHPKFQQRFQPMFQRKPYQTKHVCNLICNRQNQSCFDPSLAIIVYEISVDPRKMSFQQTFPNFDIIMNDKDTDVGNIKKDSNDAKPCPITDIDQSFMTMTAQESCAIVGNRGILLNSKCGKEIDSHNFVFRVNIAEADEPIEDVGKRIDITMLNLEIVDAMYDTLFTRRRTSQAKLSYVKLVPAIRSLNDSILWHPGSTAGSTATKLQRIAAFFRSQGMNVRFGYSFADVTVQTRRRWETKEDSSPRSILLTVAETFCKTIALYGFDSGITNLKKQGNRVDGNNILAYLERKGVVHQVLTPCKRI